MRRACLGWSLVVLACVVLPRAAAGEPPRLHLNAGAATPLGDPQAHEFGFGAVGALALEVPFGKYVGLQLEGSTTWLSKRNPPVDPRIADHGAGVTLAAMLGLRVHGAVAGPWADLNGGYVHTGNANRAGFDAHLGYDFRVGQGRWDVGPFVGYAHVFQPKDTLRPEDAHVLSFGLHVALGAPLPVIVRADRDGDTIFDDEDACPDVPGIRTSDPKTNGCPRGDRDHDGVFDDEDACIDVPGIRTSDPKTNGCPRGDRDHDGVFDDEDACIDVPGVRTDDPKTNGCPPPPPPVTDRDGDGVPDSEDACPDVPGIRTNDPKTNGCPAASEVISVVQDQIILKEKIYFETNVARVRHHSWPLVEKLAKFMNENPDMVEISIEGHTDEQGTDAYNDALSQSRADYVKVMLVRYGVDANRLKTKGYGKRRPVSTGHGEDSLLQNRRVEFIITRVRKPQGGTTQPARPIGAP